MIFRLEKENLYHFKDDLRREWILTDGLGGYSSLSVLGAPVRRYHSLFICALNPPVERVSFLNLVEEKVKIDNHTYSLSNFIYKNNVVYPEGYRYLQIFEWNGRPRWVYELNGLRVIRSIERSLLNHELTIKYHFEILNDQIREFTFYCRPLVSFRPYHLNQKKGDHYFRWDWNDYFLLIERQKKSWPPLKLQLDEFEFEEDPQWYYDFYYPVDEEKGESCYEDLFSPGFFYQKLYSSCAVDLEVSLEKEVPYSEDDKKLIEPIEIKEDSSFGSVLENAARQFLVKRGSGWSVIAGYPFFGDWGRDTMIALPGLLYHRKDQRDKIFSIFKTYIDSLSQGMIPNCFPEEGQHLPFYNTVDATLWMIGRWDQWRKEGEDEDIVRSYWSLLNEIIEWHLKGTRFDIVVDREDGFLKAGNPKTQLTWMDVRLKDECVTPRHGKAIEIQALWYNVLNIHKQWAALLGESSPYEELIQKMEENVESLFWYEEGGYLYDCVDGNTKDSSLRPNQLYALGLPYRLFKDEERSKQILSKVKERLLTPYGLRTLSPDDSRYRGRCIGNLEERDRAYHQGTVWSHLLGIYWDAYFAVYGDNEETREILRDYLTHFLNNHLWDAGLGTISEIFDGDEPHFPRGCFAQAWSVAEIYRLYRKVF